MAFQLICLGFRECHFINVLVFEMTKSGRAHSAGFCQYWWARLWQVICQWSWRRICLAINCRRRRSRSAAVERQPGMCNNSGSVTRVAKKGCWMNGGGGLLGWIGLIVDCRTGNGLWRDDGVCGIWKGLCSEWIVMGWMTCGETGLGLDEL